MYEAVIKVAVTDPPQKRARDIVEGFGYACALLKDEYGYDCDAIISALERTMNDVEDMFS